MALTVNSYSLSFSFHFLSFYTEPHPRHSEDGADLNTSIPSLSFSHYLIRKTLALIKDGFDIWLVFFLIF